MAWPEDRFSEAEAVEHRKRLISAEAESVFESLWNQVKELTEELKRHKPLDIRTNGSPHGRVVKFFADPQDKRDKSAAVLRLDFIENAARIQVTVGAEVFPLMFDVGDDDVVCLRTAKNTTPTLRAVATYVLDRLVFPDLPPMPL